MPFSDKTKKGLGKAGDVAGGLSDIANLATSGPQYKPPTSSEAQAPSGPVRPEKAPWLGPAIGSFKQGGTVPKTGNYKLHKGETVVATDPTDAYGRMGMTKARTLRSEAGRSSDPAMRADLNRKADQAVMKAHGANGNMVRSNCAACSAHDKD